MKNIENKRLKNPEKNGGKFTYKNCGRKKLWITVKPSKKKVKLWKNGGQTVKTVTICEAVKMVTTQLDLFPFQWNRRDPNNQGDMEVGKYKYMYKFT